MRLVIDIPDDIAEYGSHIENLLRLCVAKLFVNAHKVTPDIKEAEDMIRCLEGELQELKDQLTENRLKGNSLLEIADVVNFALLTYIAIRNEQMKYKGQIDERSRLRVVASGPSGDAPRAGSDQRNPVVNDSDYPKAVVS